MPAESAIRHVHAEVPPKPALPSIKCNWSTSLKIAGYFWRNPNPPEAKPRKTQPLISPFVDFAAPICLPAAG